MSIEELEVLISKKQSELSNLMMELDTPKEHITHNAGNGQVGYYTIGNREGLENEIIKLRREIEKLYQEKSILQKNKLDKEMNQVNEQQERKIEEQLQAKEIEAEKKYEELKNKANYQRVREIYKANTNFFERAAAKIKGTGLKKQANYTTEQLEYLLATYHGETKINETKHEFIERKGLNFQEEQEKKKESNISEFKKRIAQNPEILDQYIETEQASHGRSR